LPHHFQKSIGFKIEINIKLVIRENNAGTSRSCLCGFFDIDGKKNLKSNPKKKYKTPKKTALVTKEIKSSAILWEGN